MKTKQTIIIENGVIVDVKNGYTKAKSSDTVIDLKNATVTPGWMDLHVHLGSQSSPKSYSEDFYLNPEDFAYRSVPWVEKTLLAGFTTVRDVGGFATASSTDLSKSYLAGQFDEDDVRYIRITNLDSTNHSTLTFRDEDSTEFCMKVDAGHSFIYPGDNSGGVKDTMHAAGSAITVSLNDLVDITALADTDSCDVEVFVGSA